MPHHVMGLEQAPVRAGNVELVVDWIRCDGYGLCGDLAPELVALDDWRYPIIERGPIPAVLVDDARRITDCCPMRALTLRPVRERRP